MEKVSDSKGEMMMDLSIKEISIENEKINRDKFFSVGFCPEIQRYLLCVHISWVVGYDRYYAIDAEDIMLYEESPDEFCQKYAKEINTYRTERLLGAGALRDYDFRCLPDEILKNLDGYPSFKGYCYTNKMLYAQIKIDDSFFTIPPIRDEKQMDC